MRVVERGLEIFREEGIGALIKKASSYMLRKSTSSFSLLIREFVSNGKSLE
jgi:hypothetical protein